MKKAEETKETKGRQEPQSIDKALEQLATSIKGSPLEAFSALIDYMIGYYYAEPYHKIEGWKYDKSCNKYFHAAMQSMKREWTKGIALHGWHDPLGDTFMKYCQGFAAAKGQFFTPENIAELMAKIGLVIGGPKQGRETRFGRRLTIGDPTCGSGRNLIAAHTMIIGKDRTGRKPYLIGEDIDPLCVKMTALNMVFHKCFGEVICHNTLTEWGSLSFGYIIGETAYPIPNSVYLLRETKNPADYFLFNSPWWDHEFKENIKRGQVSGAPEHPNPVQLNLFDERTKNE